ARPEGERGAADAPHPVAQPDRSPEPHRAPAPGRPDPGVPGRAGPQALRRGAGPGGGPAGGRGRGEEGRHRAPPARRLGRRHRTTAAQLAGLALERQTLGKERDEARHQLDLATTRSDQSGVLTWVVPEEGATVRRGDVLARIADLGSFRVEATVSDLHAGELAAGLPVRVKVDGGDLPGRVAAVQPAIENGTVRFTVDLADPGDDRLRDRLRADRSVPP